MCSLYRIYVKTKKRVELCVVNKIITRNVECWTPPDGVSNANVIMMEKTEIEEWYDDDDDDTLLSFYLDIFRDFLYALVVSCVDINEVVELCVTHSKHTDD